MQTATYVGYIVLTSFVPLLVAVTVQCAYQRITAARRIAAAGLIGLAVGDALGVPVEFSNRSRLRRKPVTGMRGYGTHNQPPGTWSDDSSLAFCLAESLADKGIDYQDQAARFVAWWYEEIWTPHGEVFDIGEVTRCAIEGLADGVPPLEAGPDDAAACGNGSIMRILPLAIYLAQAAPQERFRRACECSRLTHGHIRCQLACAFYVEVAAALARGETIEAGIQQATSLVRPQVPAAELQHFRKIFSADLANLPASKISGSGYVIHTLEAALWCALRAESYAAGVLTAVNLGDDTDTTGAVAGGLLGLRFGLSAIPHKWQAQLVRRADILALCDRLDLTT
jgi:ADP-ribosyl-[dinitrogen reductase] hydrolase